MDTNKPIDTANEPVDLQDDDEFMDTGVLREPRSAKPVLDPESEVRQ